MYWLLFLFFLWIIALIGLLTIVWKNRSNPFFTHRSIGIIFLAQISILLASIIISTSIVIDLSIKTNLSDHFCILLNCTYSVLLPICMLSSNLMTPSLIINSTLNRMKAGRADGVIGQKWKWRMRYFCMTRNKLIILAITCAIQLVIYLVVQFTAKVEGDCQNNALYPFLAVFGLYLIPISASGYRLLDVDDPHSIRLEILITTIFSLPSMVGIILFIAGKLPFDLQFVFLYALIVIFVCNLVLPVMILLRKPSIQRHDSFDSVSIIFDPSKQNIYKSLLEYSTKQYMAENILFYKIIEEYKTGLITVEKAQHIFNEYIEIDSVLQINIDHIIREKIRINLDEPTSDLFDLAQKAIRKLIIESIVPGWRRDGNSFDTTPMGRRHGSELLSEGSGSGSHNNTTIFVHEIEM
jgi:hypothetical protein